MLKKDGIYFAYLRKSREDQTAEQNGAGDTLERHEYIIKDLAERYQIKISRWYREVVSGETISGRPEMIRLLSDVETVHPDGVLVVEVERLSRGNPQDQGRVMDTFKYSGTPIITPLKIYDLNQENDEEWMDFGLLRSRMEYRTIKRRLTAGKNASVMQGKFIGSVPPYGWEKVKLKGEKGAVLKPDPEKIEVVKMIYTLLTEGNEYTNGPIGVYKTAVLLNSLGIPAPRGGAWDSSAVSQVVKNPVHIGMVRTGYRKQVSAIVNGVKVVSHPKHPDATVVPARWDGVIPKDVYDQAVARLKQRTAPYVFARKNPLAGLVYCGACGKIMQRNARHGIMKADVLLCTTAKCPTVASYATVVEEKLVASLEQMLEKYKIEINGAETPDNAEIKVLEKQLQTATVMAGKLQKQLDKIHICLERDIYDIETYLERSAAVKSELNQCQNEILAVKQRLGEYSLSEENRRTFVPRFENIMESYKHAENADQKNELLKELISRIDYVKTKRGSSKRLDDFELDIHLRIMP